MYFEYPSICIQIHLVLIKCSLAKVTFQYKLPVAAIVPFIIRAAQYFVCVELICFSNVSVLLNYFAQGLIDIRSHCILEFRPVLELS